MKRSTTPFSLILTSASLFSYNSSIADSSKLIILLSSVNEALFGSFMKESRVIIVFSSQNEICFVFWRIYEGIFLISVVIKFSKFVWGTGNIFISWVYLSFLRLVFATDGSKRFSLFFRRALQLSFPRKLDEAAVYWDVMLCLWLISSSWKHLLYYYVWRFFLLELLLWESFSMLVSMKLVFGDLKCPPSCYFGFLVKGTFPIFLFNLKGSEFVDSIWVMIWSGWGWNCLTFS